MDTTSYASADQLAEGRLEESDVPTSRGMVRVRALNRNEQLLCVRQGDVDAQGTLNMTRLEVIERRMLARGLVIPRMTEEQVKTWQRSAPAGEIEAVANEIQRLSGMMPGAQKAAYKSVPERSGA